MQNTSTTEKEEMINETEEEEEEEEEEISTAENTSENIKDTNSSEIYSVNEIIEEGNKLSVSFKNLNIKVKSFDFKFSKDNYANITKMTECITKEYALFNNHIMKKSLKNSICKMKKIQEEKKKSSMTTKKKVFPEILKFMDIASDENSNEILVSQQEIMIYVGAYIKELRKNQSSRIDVPGKSKQFFYIIDKMKVWLEFIFTKAIEVETKKDKIEKLFPNKKVPEYLMFTNLPSYYPYCFDKN
jgi:hypothetical protein